MPHTLNSFRVLAPALGGAAVCVILLSINRYMRPEGPCQRQAAARRQRRLFKITISCPRSKRLILAGRPTTCFPWPPNQGKRKVNKIDKGNYTTSGPGPLSSPSSPKSAPSTSSGGVLLALMHPTLVLPKKASTTSVEFSFNNHLYYSVLSFEDRS